MVSLDIGTHGSGFAHAKPAADGKGAAGPQQVLMHEAWPDQPVKYAKTRSALLYDQSRCAASGKYIPLQHTDKPAAHHTRQTAFVCIPV